MFLPYPYQDIFLWSMLLSFLISLIYRLFTKPGEIRQLKKDMKFYREKSNEARKQKDMKKANEYMSETMKLSQKQMRHTMKPMFITLGLVFIILGFVNQNYSGVVVETQAVDEKTSIGQFAYAGFNHSLKAEKIDDAIKIMIDSNDNGDFSDETSYSKGELFTVGNSDWVAEPLSMNQTRMDIAVRMPFMVPFFGVDYLGWLFWYILVSLPATWIFRKALGVE
jgi:uncharacterized membrane protein (DUF106 family)